MKKIELLGCDQQPETQTLRAYLCQCSENVNPSGYDTQKEPQVRPYTCTVLSFFCINSFS